MGKVSQDNTKYVIKAEAEIAGVVEKDDIVGALFGQTEGLLGDSLDLRELRETGKVGRINVAVKTTGGTSKAEIEIPTSIDSADTALLAASFETIEKIGPSNAEVKINQIKDVRTNKRDYIVKRAKQLLQDIEKESPDKKQISKRLKKEMRKDQITKYEGFPAGPEAAHKKEIILVEGKSDVQNLVANGVKNCLAIGGTSIPEKIKNISDKKDITLFIDGDRGGKLILKELKQKSNPLYVAKAPKGKEVEELTKKQIHEALRDKKPVKHDKTKTEDIENRLEPEKTVKLGEKLNSLIGSRAVYSLDEDLEEVDKKPLTKFSESLKNQEAKYIVFDGEIDNKKIKKAEESGIKALIGMEKSETASSSQIVLLEKKDFKKEEPVN